MPLLESHAARMDLTIRTLGNHLTPSEAHTVKEHYQLSQRQLALLLGAADKTVRSWLVNYQAPSPVYGRALWLFASSDAVQQARKPVNIWDLLEASTRATAYYRSHPRATPPSLPRDRAYLRTGTYIRELHYLNPVPTAYLYHIRQTVLGVSQKQLAALLAVSQPTVNLWSNGKGQAQGVRAKLLWLLAAAPLLAEEQVSIASAFDWMATADQAQFQTTQPPWFKAYEDYPLVKPFQPSTGGATIRAELREQNALDTPIPYT